MLQWLFSNWSINMIQLKNVSYSYSRNNSPAICNLSLDIAESEFVGILGRNGSGKSTLTRLLNGLLCPEAGKVEVDGIDTSNPQNHAEIRKRVGLLLPVPDNQFISNIVEEDVAFGPENLGLSPNKIRQRVDTALKTVSMEDYAKYPPLLLSGGQKQRVCIAGILATKPKYMVLDEPTSMLDSRGRREVIETLLNLKEKEGITLVLTTHHLEEIIKADRIIVLDQGEVKFEGNPGSILKEVDVLKKLGIEPMEITVLIDRINEGCQKYISRDIYDIRMLVEVLCQ